MDVDVNYLAVFLAALSTMVVGSIWYGKVGFYKQWTQLTGAKPDPNFGGKKAVILYGGAFVSSLVTAYILAHVAFLSHSFFKNDFLQDTATTAFWLWLGFTAARLYMHDSFEGRRKRLTFLNVSHEFVTVMVMALIIGLMGV
ncbi:MAG: DUF1761 domain-containing protein [Candidatus Saccharibacteria bacterium]